ncbi:hypothetical protein THAOC_17844 [Thalassiosira oceanica]|uniref:peptidylprolyl isomerase n=1 Tax=Thalassiosira oceanica TaxID=159749 RepID=K0S6D7_THAOC|nr:hypothetical protein THAOC_17844 [Thalassiosira oceanica]|eukprot:EJK61633.1 hypothetical protein THAOC_17844 [Thalassiosira oceanica]
MPNWRGPHRLIVCGGNDGNDGDVGHYTSSAGRCHRGLDMQAPDDYFLDRNGGTSGRMEQNKWSVDASPAGASSAGKGPQGLRESALSDSTLSTLNTNTQKTTQIQQTKRDDGIYEDGPASRKRHLPEERTVSDSPLHRRVSSMRRTDADGGQLRAPQSSIFPDSLAHYCIVFPCDPRNRLRIWEGQGPLQEVLVDKGSGTGAVYVRRRPRPGDKRRVMVSIGWDESVIAMSLGEVSKIHCSPDYAYGPGGFPAW